MKHLEPLYNWSVLVKSQRGLCFIQVCNPGIHEYKLSYGSDLYIHIPIESKTIIK